MSKTLKIGWAEESITPNRKVRLPGQFYERISDQVETPITATALAVESEDEQLVICSCDLTKVSENLLAAVRERIGDYEGLKTDKIIMNATHVHTSLDYKISQAVDDKVVRGHHVLKQLLPENFNYKPLVTADEDVMTAEEGLDFLAERIAKAIKAAWSARKPGYLANGFGRAAVGMCRRVCYDDGSAKMWGDTNSANFTALEGGNDSGIELLFTYDEHKALTGVMANVACPAQVLEHRSFISSDYWGKVRGFLREKLGEDFKVLALCSAAGDMCPRDMVRWVQPETPINDPNIERAEVLPRKADPSMFDIKGSLVIGRRIATEILFAIEEAEPFSDTPVFIHQSKKITLPLRRVTPKEYQEAMDVILDFQKNSEGSITFRDNARLHVQSGTIARYRAQQHTDVFQIEVHFVRLGDIAIATNPFELFLDYGNQIRARSKASQTFLIQLACGGYGYVPTEKAERGSHYSAYVSSGYTGHVGGELLVRETVETINEMWD